MDDLMVLQKEHSVRTWLKTQILLTVSTSAQKYKQVLHQTIQLRTPGQCGITSSTGTTSFTFYFLHQGTLMYY
jgi:hypothetical protein